MPLNSSVFSFELTNVPRTGTSTVIAYTAPIATAPSVANAARTPTLIRLLTSCSPRAFALLLSGRDGLHDPDRLDAGALRDERRDRARRCLEREEADLVLGD